MMRLPLRGGNWNNGSNAGLGALNLNNSRSNSNSNIGFRPALDDPARNTCLTGQCQCYIQKDAAASANAEKQIKPLDASSGCLYEQLIQFDALLKAAYQCRKGKAHKASSLKFFNNLEENIVDLQNELTWGMYHASPYHQFYVFEPKRRLISAPNFRDRVIHRAIYNLIEPLFDKRFEFDRYAKHTLRAKRYVRYMDDFVFIHHDKQLLHQWRKDVEAFLNTQLGLRTNQKTQVFPIGVGKGRALDFLGYRIYSTHRLLRKCSVKRMKTNMKKYRKKYAAGTMELKTIQEKVQSWLGHASHANTFNLRTALFTKPFRRTNHEL